MSASPQSRFQYDLMTKRYNGAEAHEVSMRETNKLDAMHPAPPRCLFLPCLKPLRLASSIRRDLLQDLQNLVGLSHIHNRNVHNNSCKHDQEPHRHQEIMFHRKPPSRLEVWFRPALKVYTREASAHSQIDAGRGCILVTCDLCGVRRRSRKEGS